MVLYVSVKDGHSKSFITFEEAMEFVADSNNFFVVSVRRGRLMVCANSFHAFDNSLEEGKENQFALLRLRKHFVGS